jgi:hypothetical protein
VYPGTSLSRRPLRSQVCKSAATAVRMREAMYQHAPDHGPTQRSVFQESIVAGSLDPRRQDRTMVGASRVSPHAGHSVGHDQLIGEGTGFNMSPFGADCDAPIGSRRAETG